MLGQFMEQVIKHSLDTDLKQKAVFYYRLLKSNIQLAEKIVSGDHEKIIEFYEDKNEDTKERLFLEFNSLSVVYQRPAERFVKDPHVIKHLQALEKRH